METFIGKIFQSGGSQALRLPAKCSFPPEVTEVYIIDKGPQGKIIKEKKKSLLNFYMMRHDMENVDQDYLKEREDLPPEERELF